MHRDSFDVIVVGGGPAGYVAAIRLAQLGLRTLCVERESWGGVCLNWGCIPSKALIGAAGRWERLATSAAMGITVTGAKLDFARTQAWKQGIVRRLTGGVEGQLRGNGVEMGVGTARLTGSREVEVRSPDGAVSVYRAERAVVVATGARPVELPHLPFDGERVLSARDAVGLTEVPERLVVIGGGVIGMELGTLYQRLGSRLTIVELGDGILPGIDRDLTRVVERRVRRRGGEIHLGARATRLERAGGEVVLGVEAGGRSVSTAADRVLVSVGFRPNTEQLGLERLGVRLDPRGHVVVDRGFRSTVPGIFAIGDVTGPPYLAHKSFREGELAAEVIAGRSVQRDWLALPAAVFTDPEIATVGISEEEAKRQGREFRVGRFPLSASGRALSLDDAEGFVKVIADRQRVLGVGIVGPEASEVIAEAAFAIEMMASAEDVAMTIHSHPTLGESLMEAFKHLLGEAVHVPNPAARGTVAAEVLQAAGA